MFTWICPRCGSEVPPSYSECPNCLPAGAAPAPAGPVQPVAPATPVAPVVPAAPVAAKSFLPGWLVAVLVAAVLVGLGAGAYFYLLPSSKTASQTAMKDSPFEAPTSHPVPSAKPHPLAKYVEIAGLRITEDAKQRAQIKFLVVNHSGAELGDIALAVTMRPSVAKPGDKPVASFSVKVPSLRPYEARQMETSVKTELRAYELPDWQFLRAEFEITSPPAP